MKVFLSRLWLVLISVQVITSCTTTPPSKPKVAIQPLNSYDTALATAILQSIEAYYHCETYLLSPQTIPKAFFTQVKTPRYRADSIIAWLRATKSDTIQAVMGFTNLDISTTKRDADGSIKSPATRYRDWGIFGLGYRPGDASVVSTFRLTHQNRALYTERVCKVALHELGHNLGLPHCTSNTSCVMRDAAESIKTVDRVAASLCEDCQQSIRWP